MSVQVRLTNFMFVETGGRENYYLHQQSQWKLLLLLNDLGKEISFIQPFP